MTSARDCASMPVEPNAWYGIKTYNGRSYELATWQRGENIEALHYAMDVVKNTDRIRVLVWIERLSQVTIEELGL